MAKMTETEKATAGEFLREYGATTFIVVSEALGIGRVKWSLVPIGQNGQNELRFFMPVEKMLALCIDIKRGIAQKKIAADAANQYPSAYKYVTGENGSRILAIGGGKVGCRINIQDKSISKYYTMAITMSALEEMAERFLMWTGYSMTVPNSYYGNMVTAFNNGMQSRSKHHTNIADDEIADAPSAVAEPDNTANDVVSAPAPAEPAPQAPAAEGTVAEYKLTVRGTAKEKTDSTGAKCYLFDAMLGNEPVYLMFTEKQTTTITWFADFERTAKNSSIEVNVNAEKRGKYLKVIC